MDYVGADTQWFFRITGTQSVSQIDGRWVTGRRDEVRAEVFGAESQTHGDGLDHRHHRLDGATGGVDGGARESPRYNGFGIDSVDQLNRDNPQSPRELLSAPASVL